MRALAVRVASVIVFAVLGAWSYQSSVAAQVEVLDTLEDHAASSCGLGGYHRYFVNSAATLSTIAFGGEPVAVEAATFTFPAADQARRFTLGVDSELFQLLEQHAAVGETPSLRAMSFPEYGDLTVAFTTRTPVAVALAEYDAVNEVVIEGIAIQKASSVTVLIAYSATGAARQLVPIIDAFDSRWPAADNAITRGEAGDIQGGITDAVPRLGDLPVGWTIEATGTLYVNPCSQT